MGSFLTLFSTPTVVCQTPNNVSHVCIVINALCLNFAPGSDVASEIEIEMEDCANVYAMESNVILTGESALIKTVVSGEFLDLDIDRDDVGEYKGSSCY